MNLTRDRVRSIGWAAVLMICLTVTVALTFRVNAVKSQVQLAERQIVQLRREKLLLETEFETRANQQQLAQWNEVEYGYQAPGPAQFLESERQLASLGTPRAPGAPAPIRVMAANAEDDGPAFPAMVSPLTGKAFAAETASPPHARHLDVTDISRQLTQGAERVSLAARIGAAE